VNPNFFQPQLLINIEGNPFSWGGDEKNTIGPARRLLRRWLAKK